MEEYAYPLRWEWKTDEIIMVMKFYECIEKANTKGIQQKELMNQYKNFKQIVQSKSEEKQIDKEFEEVTQFSIYKTMQKAKDQPSDSIIKI